MKTLATPGLTSSSNGENYIILLFSERPIAMANRPSDEVQNILSSTSAVKFARKNNDVTFYDFMLLFRQLILQSYQGSVI